jgi:hypothetical protein
MRLVERFARVLAHSPTYEPRHRTPAACNEQSYPVALVRCFHDLLGHKLTAVGLTEGFLHIFPFIRMIGASAPRHRPAPSNGEGFNENLLLEPSVWMELSLVEYFRREITDPRRKSLCC